MFQSEVVTLENWRKELGDANKSCYLLFTCETLDYMQGEEAEAPFHG